MSLSQQQHLLSALVCVCREANTAFLSNFAHLLIWENYYLTSFWFIAVGWRLTTLHHPVVPRSIYNTEGSDPTCKVLLSQ